MTQTTLSRREFLKLISLLSLAQLGKSRVNDQYRLSGQDPLRPNILILVFDTLSARHVSQYGYGRATTPNLARFAERANVYHTHYAGGNFTSPGTASLLTGVYPWTHRAVHIQGAVTREMENKNLFHAFEAAGYHSVAYTHNPAVSVLLHQFRDGIDRLIPARELALVDPRIGERMFPDDFSAVLSADSALLWGNGEVPPTSLFLSYLNKLLVKYNNRAISAEFGSRFPRGVPGFNGWFYTLEDAIDWIQEQVNSLPQPFLAYVHLLPPHSPYTTRQDFIDRFLDGWQPLEKINHFTSEYDFPQQQLNLWRRHYDEYIAYVDFEFGRLYNGLSQSGVLDNTCLVFTSDHGELFERGIAGHITPALFQPIMHVPLLISLPGQKIRQDFLDPTSCVDLLPTLLEIIGENVPDWGEGQILPPFALGEADPDRSLFTIEAKQNSKWTPLTKATVAMVKGNYKLISYIGYDSTEGIYELYDLAQDPDERDNIHAVNPVLSGELQDELERKLRVVNAPYRQ